MAWASEDGTVAWASEDGCMELDGPAGGEFGEWVDMESSKSSGEGGSREGPAARGGGCRFWARVEAGPALEARTMAWARTQA